MKAQSMIVACALVAGGFVLAQASSQPEPPPAAPEQAPAVPVEPTTLLPLKIASCDVYRVAEKLMKQPKYASAIQDARVAAENRLGPMAKELEELRNKIQAAGGPQAAPGDVAVYQQKQPVFAQTQQQVEREFERTAAQTNHAAYTAVIEAARKVAAARGYSHVFATRPDNEGPGPDTPLQFTLGVLSRPLVICPGEDDISDAVSAELGLE
ncbi:MAG: OmpH family outer membrane protein [Phycisphaerales bacterium]